MGGRRRNRAQALLMVTLSLFAVIGLIGLAVDFGWAYFLEKNMQSAADAAALAAVRNAMELAGTLPRYQCSAGILGCQAAPTSCNAITSGNLAVGCQYAAVNGFSAATAGMNVRIQAWDDTGAPTVNGCNPVVQHPPTAPCVDTIYWVTVRIAQQVPQLFSAIWGNTTGTVSARSTAAVAEATVIGSLILINRENETTNGVLPGGTNMELQGSGTVRVPGGIVLASNSNVNSREAGRIQGTGSVITPNTYIRNPGTIGGSGAAGWGGAINQTADSQTYWDPMYQKGGQPPINTDPALPLIPVPGGALNTSICPSGVCPPGIYYAVRTLPTAQTEPTGAPITTGNNSTFRFGGTSPGYSAFGDWMFIGGFIAGNNSVINMGPGRYVYAGVESGQSNANLVDIPNGVTITGGTAENADAGRLMVLTNFKRDGYSGQLQPIWDRFTNPSNVPNVSNLPWVSNGSGLRYAKSAIQAGQNDRSRVVMYGLNSRGTNADVIAAGLDPFAPAMIWQDQGNSYVDYTDTGVVNTSCTGSLNTPCMTSPAPNPANAPQLEIWATPYAQWGGMIYQPRGAWTLLQASGTYTGPLMIISGAMKVQGTPDLTLTGPEVPLTIFVPALIE